MFNQILSGNVKTRIRLRNRIIGLGICLLLMMFSAGCSIPDSPWSDSPLKEIQGIHDIIIDSIGDIDSIGERDSIREKDRIGEKNDIIDAYKDTTYTNIEDLIKDYSPDSLIRFHVIANSDSEDDQLLKYIIRDEILKKAAPRLAESKSLEESRQILEEMEDEFLRIAEAAVREYGKDYEVAIDHGKHIFPTKSYGSIVLPGGEYEAVKVQIGEAQGANWWCVLFPPICFVNVEEATTVTVDEKPGVPLDQAGKRISDDVGDEGMGSNKDANANRNTEKSEGAGTKGVDESAAEVERKPKVKFFLARFFW